LSTPRICAQPAADSAAHPSTDKSVRALIASMLSRFLRSIGAIERPSAAQSRWYRLRGAFAGGLAGIGVAGRGGAFVAFVSDA
jgi:hypothetical protein